TCWLAKRILDALRQQSGDAGLLREEQPVLSLAALLHDITHVPFGHTFEDERRVLPRHDEHAERLDYFLGRPPLGPVLQRAGLLSARTAVLDRTRPADAAVRLMRDVVSGTVCADLLDYLKRDALFCGLRLNYDERLYRYLAVADGGLVFDLQQRGL